MTTTAKKQTKEELEAPKPRILARVRAVRTGGVFNDHVLREEGEVFDYVGIDLPSKGVVVVVDPGTPVGLSPAPDQIDGEAPVFTTPGYVKAAHLSGRGG